MLYSHKIKKIQKNIYLSKLYLMHNNKNQIKFQLLYNKKNNSENLKQKFIKPQVPVFQLRLKNKIYYQTFKHFDYFYLSNFFKLKKYNYILSYLPYDFKRYKINYSGKFTTLFNSSKSNIRYQNLILFNENFHLKNYFTYKNNLKINHDLKKMYQNDLKIFLYFFFKKYKYLISILYLKFFRLNVI